MKVQGSHSSQQGNSEPPISRGFVLCTLCTIWYGGAELEHRNLTAIKRKDLSKKKIKHLEFTGNNKRKDRPIEKSFGHLHRVPISLWLNAKLCRYRARLHKA